MLKLSPRLALVASLAGECGRIADIGTDHALLSAFLLLNASARSALLCDVVEGPLSRAAETVRQYHLEDKTELRLSDGFQNILSDEFDTALICGMGGLNIIEILAKADWFTHEKKRLILQPQTDAIHLRAFLVDTGCELLVERAVVDAKHAYSVMSVQTGESKISINWSDYISFHPAWATRHEVILGKLHLSGEAEKIYLAAFYKLAKSRADGAKHEHNEPVYRAYLHICDVIIEATGVKSTEGSP